MSARLSELVRSHYLDPDALGRTPAPVLLWMDAPPAGSKDAKELLWVTQGNAKPSERGNDPEVFRLEKAQDRVNAFALGITLGRTSNNDVKVDDPSVSRFNAYFQQDPHSGVWHVVDAESSNGSHLQGVRLQPGRPAPLVDRAELKVGHVVLQFFSPAAFERYLDERIHRTRRRAR